MSKYKLSIIIPVYGVEKFILEFTQSLFPQLTDDVECIFINDGCLDNSIKILKKEIFFFKNKDNIKVIHQENSGIGAARNSGLKVAQGNFIGFLDPDDMVKPNYIISILEVITNNYNSIDIIHINAEVLDLKNTKSKMSLVTDTRLVKVNKEYLANHFSKNMWQPWLRFFNHKLLENFSFPLDCILEDLMSFPFLYKDGINIYEINDSLVIYRLSENSATAKKNTIFFESFRQAVELYSKLKNDEHFKITYFRLIEELFRLRLKENSFYNYCNFIEEYKGDILYIRNNIRLSSFKAKFRYYFPKLFYIYKTRGFLKKL